MGTGRFSWKYRTAFQEGNLGVFEFYRMLFGLCNIHATFSTFHGEMHECNDCLIYLEDIIIFVGL